MGQDGVMDLPEHLGRLRVLGPLGSGAFATVWRAFDPDLDSPVAVKVLADNWARRADVRERFLTEARLLRRVDSDRVVRVYDVGTLDDGRPYLVMTYADGGCLADLLAVGPLPSAEALAILHQVAQGLDVLHANGIVHRDVNPHNVLLLDQPAPDGLPGRRVLLADLGVAKDLQWASGLTQPAGTGDYRAPEQRQYSAGIGPASDVYALAVLAITLLGGPLPEAARARLARATDRDPAARQARATDLTRDLSQALAPAGPDPASRPSRPRFGGRRVALLLVGGAGVVAVAGTLVWGRLSTYSSPDDMLTIRLTPGWSSSGGGPAPAAIPGANGRSASIVVARGDRRVLAAAAARRVPASEVAAAARHGECGQVSAQSVTAGDLTGTAFVWSRCPGGRHFTEIGLQNLRGTVYVAIAGPDGGPSTQDVLSGLVVRW
jgi:eukaryotic-like serine/threonine-protein kinase